jgi:hypothetical protein
MPRHERREHEKRREHEHSEHEHSDHEHSDHEHEHHDHKDGKDHCHNICIVKNGRDGRDGRDGCDGKRGRDGRDGCDGCDGKRGRNGKRGRDGKHGRDGKPGVTGAADFYALIPGDNAATVAPGTDVAFPQDGVNTDTNITRISAYTFNIENVGTYLVQFQVSVTEAGQLCLALNGVEEPFTFVGRATGTSQLVGNCLIKTVTENTIVSVRNPSAETTALTITPLAGGTNPVSAHLLFLQIA